MSTIDMGKRSRRGPVSLSADALRQHCVSVRLNAAELALLDENRGRWHRGEWMRMAGIGKLPPSIPEINLKVWASLAQVASNLNQYQVAINCGKAKGYPPDVLEVLRDDVQLLRRELIGASSGDGEALDDERHE
ncbi:hypothetical protein ACSDBR_10610 [Acidithiobacillus ferriphilus]|uniref:hypothetical protein n=1 Tax=Acidithiobacillus ferriphilus TaxID=1689834 RepID=UPI003F5177EE